MDQTRQGYLIRAIVSFLVIAGSVLTLVAIRAAEAARIRVAACGAVTPVPTWSVLTLGLAMALLVVATIWSAARTIRSRWHIQEVAVLIPAVMCLVILGYVHYVAMSGLWEVPPSCRN